LQTSTVSYDNYDSPPEDSPPASIDYFSPPQTPIDSPLNYPIVSTKEPGDSRPSYISDDVFSPPADHEIPPLFYNDYKKTEKIKSAAQEDSNGFFEFGIFPKSNSFFLQNYKG
jgi:hypothetical protein